MNAALRVRATTLHKTKGQILSSLSKRTSSLPTETRYMSHFTTNLSTNKAKDGLWRHLCQILGSKCFLCLKIFQLAKTWPSQLSIPRPNDQTLLFGSQLTCFMTLKWLAAKSQRVELAVVLQRWKKLLYWCEKLRWTTKCVVVLWIQSRCSFKRTKIGTLWPQAQSRKQANRNGDLCS